MQPGSPLDGFGRFTNALLCASLAFAALPGQVLAEVPWTFITPAGPVAADATPFVHGRTKVLGDSVENLLASSAIAERLALEAGINDGPLPGLSWKVVIGGEVHEAACIRVSGDQRQVTLLGSSPADGGIEIVRSGFENCESVGEQQAPLSTGEQARFSLPGDSGVSMSLPYDAFRFLTFMDDGNIDARCPDDGNAGCLDWVGLPPPHQPDYAHVDLFYFAVAEATDNHTRLTVDYSEGDNLFVAWQASGAISVCVPASSPALPGWEASNSFSDVDDYRFLAVPDPGASAQAYTLSLVCYGSDGSDNDESIELTVVP